MSEILDILNSSHLWYRWPLFLISTWVLVGAFYSIVINSFIKNYRYATIDPDLSWSSYVTTIVMILPFTSLIGLVGIWLSLLP